MEDKELEKFLPEDQEIDVDRAFTTKKEMVTTTIQKAVKEYIDKHGINVNRLIEIGFRQLIIGHRTNNRLGELEQKTTQLQKAIDRYDFRIKEMSQKFCELKEKYKILEDI